MHTFAYHQLKYSDINFTSLAWNNEANTLEACLFSNIYILYSVHIMPPREPWYLCYSFMLLATWLINEEIKKIARGCFSIYFEHSFHQAFPDPSAHSSTPKHPVVLLSSICNAWNYLGPLYLSHHLEISVRTEFHLSWSTVYGQH